jgi:hypothetical protein
LISFQLKGLDPETTVGNLIYLHLKSFFLDAPASRIKHFIIEFDDTVDGDSNFVLHSTIQKLLSQFKK